MDEILVSGSVGLLLDAEAAAPPKPLLRGWFHLGAAVGAVLFTGLLAQQSQIQGPRLVSLVIFGLSTINLYTVSAIYHLGSWRGTASFWLRALDRANIFVLIAATYTPLCYNLLSGWLRPAALAAVWTLTAAGVTFAPFANRAPRWLVVAIYVSMGWICLPLLPAFTAMLPWQAFALALTGGLIYSAGAVMYALQSPNPIPRVLGYHELFHLCVIAGGITFSAIIWLWVLPVAQA
jgi:hemolysin III